MEEFRGRLPSPPTLENYGAIDRGCTTYYYNHFWSTPPTDEIVSRVVHPLSRYTLDTVVPCGLLKFNSTLEKRKIYENERFPKFAGMTLVSIGRKASNFAVTFLQCFHETLPSCTIPLREKREGGTE